MSEESTNKNKIPFKFPSNAVLVAHGDIDTSERVRQDFDPKYLNELAESIMAYGLLHPPTVDEKYKLIGGEQRFRAMRDVIGSEYIPVSIMSVPKADRLELELEENFRRRDFDWKESVLGIARLHDYKRKNHVRMGKAWRQADTAKLLGLSSHAHVSHVLVIAPLIEKNDQEIVGCMNIKQAWDIILRRKEQEANEIKAKKYQLPAKVSEAPKTPAKSKVIKFDDLDGLDSLDSLTDAPAPVSPITPELSDIPAVIPLSEWLKKESDQNMGPGSLMAQLDAESVDHIICDPPYAIDVNTMGLKNVDEIADTHDVEQNVSLLANFIPLAFRALKPGGFLAFWYDNVHWEFLYKTATAAGFAVQRWPVVWCKEHQCRNQSASHNYTKATEFAMICRKPGATLATKANKNFFQADGSIERKLYSNPFSKPQEAWEFMLKHIAHKGQTVLDPFMGQGSSIRAMINLGYQPLGFEVDEHHFNKCYADIVTLLKSLYGNNVNIA